MSNYTVTTDFAAKDSLPSGNSGKIIKGSEFSAEFNNIATASATKADLASPTFTGTVVIPTATITTANISGGAVVVDSLDLDDNDKIKLGTGNDLELYHDGSNSIVADVGTGNLELRGTNVVLQNSAGSETLASFTENGGSVLYYDNSAKLATDTNGVSVSGNVDMGDNSKVLLGDGDDLEMYHSGSNSIIKNSTGGLKLLSDSLLLKNAADDEFFIKGTADGAVEIYYDNGKKIETLTNGAKVTGTLIAGSRIGIGVDSPQKPLHVYSGTTDVVGRFESGDSTAGVEFIDNTSTAQIKIQDGDLTIAADTDADTADSTISLRVDNLEKVSIGESLNVIKQATRVNDDNGLSFGNGTDLTVSHVSSSNINTVQNLNNRNMVLNGTSFVFQNQGADEKLLELTANGAVDMYYNNNKKIETTATGVEVTGDLDTDSITLGTVKILTGSGAPSVSAPVGSLYTRTDGGAGSTLYVKESGTDSSGWVAK